MAWLYLALAGAFEIAFASSMKAADGFSRLWPTLITAVAVAGSIACLTLALRDLPLTIGYTVWIGIGAVGTVILGLILFGEGMSGLKALGITAIIGGVIALQFAESSST
jgi:quaternary ammonium compound-resistance protein SugE